MKTAEAVQALKMNFPEAIVDEVNLFEQTTLEVQKDKLREVLSFLKQVPTPGYETLMDLTAVDFLTPQKRTKVIYWLHNPTNYHRLRIVCFVEREGFLPSVTDLWEGANWYEREIFDLFGIQFVGHPALKRLLLPDDWKGHPLLRDYPLTEEPVQFKHGVKPKKPSEIIPHA